MVKCKDGPYVDFEQHQEIVAALAAENKRLIELGNNQMVEKFELQAENERLRKAGDAMAHWIDHQYHKDGYPFVEGWDAAKEGSDAK